MPESQNEGLGTTLGTLRVGPLTIVSESDTLQSVAEAMLENGSSCAVLREEPLRVVTEHDLAGAWSRGQSASDPVGDIATSNPCWAPVTASVAEAAALMVHAGIRHLVVLGTDGRPIGVVSMPELFSVLVHNQEPMALYASFATFMMRGASLLAGETLMGSATNADVGSRVVGGHVRK